MAARIEPPTLPEIEAAAEGLAPVLVQAPPIPYHADASVLLASELWQPTGSFKVRGVLHAVSRLAPERRARGLMTVSAGNTAKALAWCGQRFGVPAVSLMPEHAPRTKVEAVRRLGGEPRLVPVAELFEFLETRAWEAEEAAFVHPWIERDVMIGHGTLGLEILAACPDVDTVYLPVGGGGLCGGVAAALRARRPSLRIVAVEPAGCPAFHDSLARGEPTRVACATICDGVAVPYMTEEVFPLLRSLVDECVLVEEAAVEAAVRDLALGNHLVVEAAGALATAAALAEPRERRGRCVAPLTGGSIDAEELARIVAGR